MRFSVSRLLSGASLAAALALSLAGPALAQQRDWVNPDVIDLREQVQRLQRDVDRMRGGGVSGGGGAVASGGGSGVSGDAYVRLDQLEVELRQLTGRIERMEHSMRQAIRLRDERILDLQYRMQVVEENFGGPQPQQPTPLPDPFAGGGAAAGGSLAGGYVGGNSAAGGGVAAGGSSSGGQLGGVAVGDGNNGRGAPPQILGELNSDGSNAAYVAQPQYEGATVGGGQASGGQTGGAQVAAAGGGSYEDAVAKLRIGEYDQAESQLKGFIQSNPNDPRVGEATFWLGEISFARGQYDEAAKVYLNSFRNYPDSRYAPDSLLKLGMTLSQLGQSSEACLTFKEVAVRYPDASASVLRRADNEAKNAGCQ